MVENILIGFDIGGTNARYSIISEKNNELKILHSSKYSIRQTLNPTDLVMSIAHSVHSSLQNLNIDIASVRGLGIAIAGQCDLKRGIIVNAPNLNWQDVPLKALVEEHLPELPNTCSIVIANDLNAIAWGEYKFGAAKNLSHVLAIYVGTGIGAGIILHGKLYLGANDVSGEIGHSKFPNQPHAQCGCGQKGCVEAYAGGKAIEYRILHDIQNQWVTRSALNLDEEEHPTARTIELAYKQGLPYAKELWHEVSENLALLASNALALLNPHALLLGGGVLQGCPSLLTLVVEKILRYAPAVSTQNLQFIRPSLHDDAGTLGAALLSLESM